MHAHEPHTVGPRFPAEHGCSSAPHLADEETVGLRAAEAARSRKATGPVQTKVGTNTMVEFWRDELHDPGEDMASDDWTVWREIGWAERDAIPAREAVILWRHSDDRHRRVVDVLVTRLGDGAVRDRSWRCSWGAVYTDWLSPGDWTMNPEWVFGELLLVQYGFRDGEVAEKAIRMFARIRECDWARRMVAPRG